MNDVSEIGYYESPLGYDNVDWFVKEVIKLENNWLSILKTLKKYHYDTKKTRRILKITIFVDFVKKKFYLIKLEIIVT